jgi:hypothetical protein
MSIRNINFSGSILFYEDHMLHLIVYTKIMWTMLNFEGITKHK